MKDFDGARVWITGGGSGLGRHMAMEFASAGARVAVSGRRMDRLEETVAEIERLGGQGLAVTCDVGQEEQVVAAVARVTSDFGGLDVAVANAGLGVAKPIAELTAEDWERQLRVNVIGLAQSARHALPHLMESRGRLALVASVMSMVSIPGSGAYAASKAAVRAIGQTLSMELHGTGVTCTTIYPGFVESEFGQVDNRGVFRPDRADPRPAKLMWRTDDAARVMVRAIHGRKRDYVFTWHGKVGAFLGRHAPGLVHAVVTRGGIVNKR